MRRNLVWTVLTVASCFAITTLLSACTSLPGGSAERGSRLLPWNWFKPDSAPKLLQAETRKDAADDEVRKGAQEMVVATKAALTAESQRQASAGTPVSLEVEAAKDFNARADAALALTEGPLPADRIRELEELVRLRTSQLADERAMGAKLLDRIDADATRAATDQAKAAAQIDKLQGQVTAEQQRAIVAEAKLGKFWFWVWTAGVVWIFVAFVLPILARAFPAVGAVAAVGQSIVAPFAVGAARTAKRVAGDLVGGIHDLRTKLKQAPLTKAEADDVLREWVTESDGTAAYVDTLRREQHLIS